MIDYETYKKIQELRALSVPHLTICKKVGISFARFTRWALLPEDVFLNYLNNTVEVKAEKYREYIMSIISITPQISDRTIWLRCKEEFHDFDISTRSFYRYVKELRTATGHLKSSKRIQLLRPEDTPGYEAQVDFGQYKMKDMYGFTVRVYFFCMILAYSRMKYVYFSADPFTTKTACKAHDFAFKYFGGRPQTLLYDQDKLFIVSENFGDFILTEKFDKYVRDKGLTIRFCHKNDPGSKGKVELTVKQVKNSFLPGRIYTGIDVLNEECLNWLDRTGNGDYHDMTKKIPRDMFKEEHKFLQKVKFENTNTEGIIKVTSENYIRYKGNTYDIPVESNLAKCMVKVVEEDGMLLVYRPMSDELVTKYKIPEGEGHRMSGVPGYNNGHLNALDMNINSIFGNDAIKNEFIENCVKLGKPRYEILMKQRILRLARFFMKDDVLEAMSYCNKVKKYTMTELFAFMIYKHGRARMNAFANSIDMATYSRRANEIRSEQNGKN